MDRHILSALVENQPGLLSRVSGLFARRGYNIESITAGTTQNLEKTRMTIVATGDEYIIDQIKKQLSKLVDVIQIIELKKEKAVARELALIKVKIDEKTLNTVTGIVDIFRSKIIDVTKNSLTVEITGDEGKVQSFIELMEPYGIKEIARTGIAALERGEIEILDHNNMEEE